MFQYTFHDSLTKENMFFSLPRQISKCLLRAWLFVAFFQLLILSGCPQSPKPVMVVRKVNGTWSPDNNRILVFESQYMTTNPEEPYFNAISGYDWVVVVYGSESDMEEMTELVRWKDFPMGEYLQYSPGYWLKEQKNFLPLRTIHLF
jgi:hypothetical protein